MKRLICCWFIALTLGCSFKRGAIKRLIRTAYQRMSKSYISAALREQVRREARFRCGYCLTPELYTYVTHRERRHLSRQPARMPAFPGEAA